MWIFKNHRSRSLETLFTIGKKIWKGYDKNLCFFLKIFFCHHPLPPKCLLAVRFMKKQSETTLKRPTSRQSARIALKTSPIESLQFSTSKLYPNFFLNSEKKYLFFGIKKKIDQKYVS